MDRRRFLASAGAVSAVSLAGCAGVSGVREPTARWTQDGSDVYASFSGGGGEVATTGVRFRSGTARDEPVSFRIWVEQEGQTSLTDVQLTLRYENQHSSLYMKPPSGRPWPEFQYTKLADDQGVRFAVSDLGTQADGTVTLGFLFDDWDEMPRLGFDVSFGLTTGGLLPTRWRCEASRNIELPATV